ncbi:YVTN repeat-like/Quino protein amine dehydrogenase [Gonapodya prolifera JEL478]|uniref:YVTN repeat-like/Quino protein amine dehydrogenase n=1 Tax=Gonapodya prolifera (strain JEL478) TaxID=1344416 RepID=A0A139AWV8_GONPJ|nr:YVTN repeat-like/Quino protein amine dehydrogenase [Gonapodya prolifera JEL478]|eukprot:KXS21187.1 YVTN repeat-like/Quino protein amine dehydrogenase [Gonapodya prolifera JEL478]
MDFTEVYKQTSQLVLPSPSSALLAVAVSHRLVVRDADTLQIRHLFACTDAISDVVWSPDSRYIAVASKKLGLIQVWAMDDTEWSCKIEAGAEGLERIRWAPDGRSIMCFSDFQLRVTVWSLIERECAHIQYPKYTDRAFSFRPDGRYLALAERRDGKDHVSVYDAEEWVLLKNWPADTTDLEDLAWSPDGRYIALWESPLAYNLLIYHPDGRLVSRIASPPNPTLGVRSAAWHPGGQFIAVAGYDGVVRLVNWYTWTATVVIGHPALVEDVGVPVFKEIDLRDSVSTPAISGRLSGGVGGGQDLLQGRPKLRFQLVRPPYTIPRLRIEPDKPNPKTGVGVCQWSADGRWLVTRHDASPHTLYIWSLHTLKHLAVIHHTSSVRVVQFNPRHANLITWCCGNGYVYVARLPADADEERGVGVEVEAVEVPAVGFSVVGCKWMPDGKGVVVMDKEKFAVGFLVEGSE